MFFFCQILAQTKALLQTVFWTHRWITSQVSHLSSWISSTGVSVKTCRGNRWWKDLARWGAKTSVKPVRRHTTKNMSRCCERTILLRRTRNAVGSADHTYRTLYTLRATLCICRDTVDRSIPQETDLDLRRRPDDWERHTHTRTVAEWGETPFAILTCCSHIGCYLRHTERRLGILVCRRGAAVLREAWAGGQIKIRCRFVIGAELQTMFVTFEGKSTQINL